MVISMKEILNYPKCESVEDVEKFKSFMIEKMTPIFLNFKGLTINKYTLNDFKMKLINKYPVVRDIRHIKDGDIAIEFNEVYLFSKNMIINDDNQIELNNNRYKLYIDNKNELHISNLDLYGSKINDETIYICEMI